LDLMFYYYERNIYTIKPYRAIVENYLDITREAYIEAFKLASLDNGDIISKTGYQPMGYLRLTDEYDNNINRNLLLDSINRDAINGGSTSRRVIYSTSEPLIPGEYYTITYDIDNEDLDSTSILIGGNVGDRDIVYLDKDMRNKFTF